MRAQLGVFDFFAQHNVALLAKRFELVIGSELLFLARWLSFKFQLNRDLGVVNNLAQIVDIRPSDAMSPNRLVSAGVLDDVARNRRKIIDLTENYWLQL